VTITSLGKNKESIEPIGTETVLRGSKGVGKLERTASSASEG